MVRPKQCSWHVVIWSNLTESLAMSEALWALYRSSFESSFYPGSNLGQYISSGLNPDKVRPAWVKVYSTTITVFHYRVKLRLILEAFFWCSIVKSTLKFWNHMSKFQASWTCSLFLSTLSIFTVYLAGWKPDRCAHWTTESGSFRSEYQYLFLQCGVDVWLGVQLVIHVLVHSLLTQSVRSHAR